MKMKSTFLFFILFSNSISLNAQNNTDLANSIPLNSIYINFLGDASIISANYERRLIVENSFFISSKLGLGYNEDLSFCLFCPPPEKLITIPYHATANVGKGIHFFEIGLGSTLSIGNTPNPFLLYPIIGYRVQPIRTNRLNFRIYGEMPFEGMIINDMLFIPFGCSIGLSF